MKKTAADNEGDTKISAKDIHQRGYQEGYAAALKAVGADKPAFGSVADLKPTAFDNSDYNAKASTMEAAMPVADTGLKIDTSAPIGAVVATSRKSGGSADTRPGVVNDERRNKHSDAPMTDWKPSDDYKGFPENE